METTLCGYHSHLLSSHHVTTTRRRNSSKTFSKLFKILIACLVLFSLPNPCSSQCTEQAGCFPPIGNLAIGRTVNTSSTCTAGAEYCVFLQTDCLTCMPNTTTSPANLNDNDESTVWVSQVGASSLPSVLQFDFEAAFLFDGTSIVFESVRPQSMILERSRDFGVTWEVYRYYSTSCDATFGLNDTFVNDEAMFDSFDPICTSSQSLFFPFSGGRVTFSTSQHSPSASVEAITQYTTMTNIRIQLLATFGELGLSGDDFVFFAISEWYVNGQCLCNGHSDSCVPRPGEEVVANKVYGDCACEHNTIGDQCEVCAPGFNNLPWSAGTVAEANVCQDCVCNEHAQDCEYISTQSSAVCTNCSDNTAGEQCEQCLPGFFQDMSLLLNDPNICTACDCSPMGSSDALCNGQGQCNCKNNVDPASLKCTECLDGFWNLTEENPDGCQVCDCAVEGTQLSNGLPLCDKVTGQCVCNSRAQGRRCDQCIAGFYDLSFGCLSCNCNQGGSEIPVCDQTSPVAQCPCIPNVGSITCTSPQANYFFKPLDSIIFEAEEAVFPQESQLVYPLEGAFTGRGFIVPAPHTDVRFTFSVPQVSQYEIIIRYMTPAPADSISFTLYSQGGVGTDLDCDTTLVPTNVSRFHIASLLPGQQFHSVFSACLDNCVEYDLLLEYNSFSAVEWMLDSLLLLPAFSEVSDYYQAQSTQDQVTIIEPCLPRAASNQLDPLCEEATFSLSTEYFGQVFACDCDPTGSVDNRTCAAFGGSCDPCLTGVTGVRCDQCRNGFFGFSTNGCQECGCDLQGSSSPVCDQDSGQCICLPGVRGRTCNECLPGFFNLTSSGCSPCSCSEYAFSESCDDLGQCSCPDGVGGLKCDACLPAFYNISSEGCMECECDPFGSLSDACDLESGQCVCTGNSVGLNCNECPDDSFLTNGISRERCVECVCLDRTNECSVDESNFILGAVQSSFTSLCTSAPTDCSNGWTLLTNDGQVAAPFGPSDASGLGYILLLNHQPMLFAPDHFIGNRLGAYGQNFSMVVNVGQSLTGNGVLLVNSTIARMVGAINGVVLVGVFPYPGITENGFISGRILSFSIPMVEQYWFVGDMNGPSPTRLQFLSVLANIGQLSVSADFTQDIIEFIHVLDISLISTFSATDLTSTNIEVIVSPYPVEDCSCPEGFSGSSCQECARGYARPSGDVTDVCVRCECNNQTLDCDSSTGMCLDCAGNTEGVNCERCSSGYYGDPTRGIPCVQCACPLVENSFSATCLLDTSDDMQICDSCAVGYTGRSCEICMDGYFGNPLIGFCNDCECNGNVDPSLGPVCDTTTGQCMNCLNDTTGFDCGVCRPGFYGDPRLPDQPCQACPCDPRGSVGDCDRLFGECTCQTNVRGSLCNECEDGYWGLSQGLGCLQCDCCTNGSVSSTCNKDTGACDCLPNVGSSVDDKCCTCSPGFFNFLSSTGCDACDCSPLSISNECDLQTGRCQCEDGAIGLKCDDCAFGFIGQVPNCERCHECYFQWYDIISSLSTRISDLRTLVDSLITTYYNGHSLESIRTEIDRLVVLLDNATVTLDNITLQESDVADLEASLNEINSSLSMYITGVSDIQQALDVSEMNIDRANDFDGTVNMSDVAQLQRFIYMYNSTINATVENASNSFDMLNLIQVEVYGTWRELNNLDLLVDRLVSNLTSIKEDVSNVDSQLSGVRSDYDVLRGNLSFLDSQANQLLRQLNILSRLLMNASVSLRVSNGSVLALTDELEQRLQQVGVSLELARELNQTVRNALSVAMDANTRTQMLLEKSEKSVNEANTTLSEIIISLQNISNIFDVLSASKDMAQNVLSLNGLPIEYATYLAESINSTILPEEFVEEIQRNASNGHVIAREALSNAQNAYSAISNASTLIENVQDDLNCSLEQQEQLRMNLTDIEETIELTDSELDQISVLSDVLDDIREQTAETFNSAVETIDNSHQTISNSRSNLMELVIRANQIANDTSQHRQGVDDVVDTYQTDLMTQVASTHNEANSSVTTAESLYQQAQSLSSAAEVISLQELQELLRSYMNETMLLNSLSSRVDTMQQELIALTTSLTSAADRLRDCYKTP